MKRLINSLSNALVTIALTSPALYFGYWWMDGANDKLLLGMIIFYCLGVVNGSLRIIIEEPSK